MKTINERSYGECFYSHPNSPITGRVIDEIERFERTQCRFIEEISEYIEDLLGVVMENGVPSTPPPLPTVRYNPDFPHRPVFRDDRGRLKVWFDVADFSGQLPDFFEAAIRRIIDQVQAERSCYLDLFVGISPFLAPKYFLELLRKVECINQKVAKIMGVIENFRRKMHE